MLHHLVNRLRTVPSLDAIVLATTSNVGDDVLETFAKQEQINFFRGSENDVMQRVIDAACSVNADVVVEIKERLAKTSADIERITSQLDSLPAQ